MTETLAAVETYILLAYVVSARSYHPTLAKMTDDRAVSFFVRWIRKHIF
jgi:hypothetical protein